MNQLTHNHHHDNPNPNPNPNPNRSNVRRTAGMAGRTRVGLAGAAVVAALLILAGIIGLGAGGTSALEPSSSATAAVDAPETTQLPTTQPPASEAATDGDAVGAQVARPAGAVSVLDAPDGTEVRSLAPTTDFGSQRALLVTAAQPGWLQVLVPGRPNGLTGWIRADGVEVATVPIELQIDLSSRSLSVRTPDGSVIDTPVAIGSPEAPTPTGRFSVTDKLATGDDGSDYGPFALGLSGRSEVLSEFGGGDGQIGIHGTNAPDSIGQNVSHGCIRVPNEVITTLNELVPLGTPVVIV